MDERSADKHFGPAAAAILAAGLGALTLGALATLREAIASFGDWLAFSGRVGMLSGETTIASGVYFLSWAILALVWRRSDPPLRLVVAVTAILVLLGLIGTFPVFFHLFGSEE